MHALLLSGYGEPPHITLGRIEDPLAQSGQVRVRVEAAGLNPIDHKLARGWMAAVMDFELPIALGWDVAGVVEAAGADVERFVVGQPVFGSLGPPTGTAAELVVADAEGPWIAERPAGLAATVAASLPMVGLTAQTIMRELRREGTVLVIGAGGGIGAFLVPLLIRAGLNVIATASGESLHRLSGGGAQAIIDFRAVDVAQATRVHAPDGVDAVVDLINQFDQLQRSAELVRPDGQLLSTLFGPDPGDFIRQDVEITYVRNSPQVGDLERVAGLVADGTVVPVPVHPYPFTEAAAAFDRLAGGRTAGKLVLDLTAGPRRSDPQTKVTTGVPA